MFAAIIIDVEGTWSGTYRARYQYDVYMQIIKFWPCKILRIEINHIK